MRRLAAMWIAALLLSGCRAPMPSMNLLAAYGTPRVPPPATGSYGASDAYYPAPATTRGAAPATSAPIGAGLRQNSKDTRWTQSDADGDSMRVPGDPSHLRVADVGTVRAASYAAAENSEQVDGTTVVSATAAPRPRGMPVTDVTRLEEPERFQPPPTVRDISQLPRTNESSTVAVPSQESRATEAEPGTSTPGGTGWRARPAAGNGALRVAHRSP